MAELHTRKSVRPWLIACDQAGAVQPDHYGFGTLWMPYDRRGDFVAAFRQICDEAGFEGELHWDEIGPGPRHRLACGLVDYFCRNPWLAFHCLVVEAKIVDLDRHNEDFDLARRKHFTLLLSNKIKRALSKFGHEQEFRVWVSPIPSAYAKAAEAVEVISGNVIAQFSRRKPNLKVATREMQDTPALQLCGVLLGAVLESWQNGSANQQKRNVGTRLARHLGWDHLRYDTAPRMRRFNVWKFHDPMREPCRSASTRTTNLG